MPYWVDTCRLCGQGRLFVFMTDGDRRLYLHCEECEWGWWNPCDLAVEQGFLTLDKDFASRAATREEIEAAGWAESIRGSDQPTGPT